MEKWLGRIRHTHLYRVAYTDGGWMWCATHTHTHIWYSSGFSLSFSRFLFSLRFSTKRNNIICLERKMEMSCDLQSLPFELNCNSLALCGLHSFYSSVFGAGIMWMVVMFCWNHVCQLLNDYINMIFCCCVMHTRGFAMCSEWTDAKAWSESQRLKTERKWNECDGVLSSRGRQMQIFQDQRWLTN